MENRIVAILMFLLFFTTSACDFKRSLNEADYLEWMSDQNNGLVKVKKTNGFVLKFKNVPPEYLAHQELKNDKQVDQELVKNLVDQYSKSLTFIMTIGVDDDVQKGDIMYHDVRDYQEYKTRLMTMNFDMSEFITLSIGDISYKPVLANLENNYGLIDSRNISLVFVPKDENDKAFFTDEKLRITYDDEIFKTGINHFTFIRKDITKVPKLLFASL